MNYKRIVRYSPYAKLRFMCHCDANPSCEWCKGKGFYHTSELSKKELEDIHRELETIIKNRTD